MPSEGQQEGMLDKSDIEILRCDRHHVDILRSMQYRMCGRSQGQLGRRMARDRSDTLGVSRSPRHSRVLSGRRSDLPWGQIAQEHVV